MSKPFIHAKSSAKTFGGKPSDYVKIHEKMDCSKGEIGDLRHRALTHHMFFVRECVVPIFGSVIVNSDGNEVSVVEICEWHMMEDFSDSGKQQGFIPTAGDYLAELNFETWLNNGQDGAHPASHNKRVEWSERSGKKTVGVDSNKQKKYPPLSIDGGNFGPPKPSPFEPIEIPDHDGDAVEAATHQDDGMLDTATPLDHIQSKHPQKPRPRADGRSFIDGPMRFD